MDFHCIIYYFCDIDEMVQNEKVGLVTWEIQRESLRLIAKLGVGKFAEEWSGIFNNAIKVIVKTPRNEVKFGMDFLREAEVMKQLKHRNLVQVCI